MKSRLAVGLSILLPFQLCMFLSTITIAQEQPTDSLVKEIMLRGIDYSDDGKYDLALMEFEKARELDPKDGFINYETALAHYQLHNNDKALGYAKTATKESSEHGLQAFILRGTIYDEQGKYRKSIKAFEKGVKSFGDYYLLHYNIGVTALDHNDYERADEAFQMALRNKLDHLDSQFGLAKVKSAEGRKSEAIYPLYFYLLLAPDDTMAAVINQSIVKLRALGVSFSKTDDKADQIKKQPGGVAVYNADDGMLMADMKLSILESVRGLDTYSGSTDFEAELDMMTDFFLFVDQVDFGKRDDLYTEYYVPFFAAIARSDHMPTFLHYVRQSYNQQSAEWVKSNYESLELFFNWLDQEAPKIKPTDDKQKGPQEIGPSDD